MLRVTRGRLPLTVGGLVLLALPLIGQSNSEVIGRVIGSKAAFLGGTALPESGIILNNDQLTTGPGGKALVQFLPTARASLSENTAVKFTKLGSSYFGALTSGSVVAETKGARAFVVQTSEYKVGPAGRSKTIFLVTVRPDGSTVVAAQSGGVAITEVKSGREYLLPRGEYAAIPAPSKAVGGPIIAIHHRKKRKSPGAWWGAWHIGTLSHEASVGIVTASGEGTAVAIALPLSASGAPASPSTP